MSTGTHTLQDIGKLLDEAKTPEEIFLSDVRAEYRRLSMICHPDTNSEKDKELATRLFQSLNNWKDRADKSIEDGTYGTYREVIPLSFSPVKLKILGADVTLSKVIADGLLSRVYEVESSKRLIAKIANNPKDNDLLENEYKTLRKLYSPKTDYLRDFLRDWKSYIPYPDGTAILSNGPTHRRVNILFFPQGDAYTIETLRRMPKFQDGVDPRHMFWIFRRLLLTLHYAHESGVVHGGVTPDHVLVYPEGHGIILLDWTSAAVLDKTHVPVINKKWMDWYPKSVLEKEHCTRSMDIQMAIKTALYLVDATGDLVSEGRLLKPVKDYLNSHLRYCHSKTALDIYNEFEKVIEAAYGERKFLEFKV